MCGDGNCCNSQRLPDDRLPALVLLLVVHANEWNLSIAVNAPIADPLGHWLLLQQHLAGQLGQAATVPMIEVLAAGAASLTTDPGFVRINWRSASSTVNHALVRLARRRWRRLLLLLLLRLRR